MNMQVSTSRGQPTTQESARADGDASDGDSHKKAHGRTRDAHDLNAKPQRPKRSEPDAEARRRATSLPPSASVHGEREVRLGRDAHAGTRGRVGHAGAGISTGLAAEARGAVGLPMDDPGVLLALGGDVGAGAGFDQYASAGLGPWRVGGETLVEEPLGVGQQSHGFAGARAKAGGSVGLTHAEGHVEAFAGAKTGGQTHLTVGDQRLQIGGDAMLGVGLEAGGSVGLRRTPEGKTRLKLEGKVGAALGVGGSIAGGVDLDVTPLADAVEALPRPARKGLKSLGRSAARAGKALGDAAKSVAKVAKEAVVAPVRFFKSLFS